MTAAVARYAGRLHAVAGAGHHVASPLGAWLLLALCVPASGGAAPVFSAWITQPEDADDPASPA